jgi:serine/threonine protein kinase
VVDGTPFGRYRLVALLGRGGMGEVWRAYDPAHDRFIALKVLSASFGSDHVFQERFRREARAAAGLDDPHVVPIHDSGEIDGQLFVSMKLVKGRDLQDLLDDGPLPPARAVGIIEQVASALHAAHKVHLVHRDVKPSNILVAEDDFAYLIDFGIARAAGESGLTSTGATIGTWAYMAPERFKKGGVADARADIYALACVLYQALTGEPPFPADAIEQIAVAHMLEAPPRPSELAAGVDGAMDDVIAIGMGKDPDGRYRTTKDLARAARAALPTQIPGPSAASPAPTLPGGRVGHQAFPAIVEASTMSGETATRPTLDGPESGSVLSPTQVSPTAPTLYGSPRQLNAPPPLARPVLPMSASPTISGGRGDSTVPPTDATLVGKKVPFFKRIRGRTKIIAAVVAVIAIATAVVVTIVLGNNNVDNNVDPSKRLAAVLSSAGCSQTIPPSNTPAGAAADTECGNFDSVFIHLNYAVFPDRATFNNAATGALNPQGAETCPGMGQSPQQWHSPRDSQQSGRLACSTWYAAGINTTFAIITWTIDSDLVLASGQGAPGKTMDEVFQWWAAHYQ